MVLSVVVASLCLCICPCLCVCVYVCALIVLVCLYNCTGQWSYWWWLLDSCLLSTPSPPHPSHSITPFPFPQTLTLCISISWFLLDFGKYLHGNIQFLPVLKKPSRIPLTPIPITFCRRGQKEAKPSVCSRRGLPLCWPWRPPTFLLGYFYLHLVVAKCKKL